MEALLTSKMQVECKIIPFTFKPNFPGTLRLEVLYVIRDVSVFV